MTNQKNKTIAQTTESTAGQVPHFLEAHTREKAEREAVPVVPFPMWVCWKAEQIKDGRISKQG